MINLFARNFDEQPEESPPEREVQDVVETPDLTEQLETARQEGFDAGRRIGRQEAQAEADAKEGDRLSTTQAAIQAELARLSAADAMVARQMEHDIVELFSGIAERLVPELLETYGPELAVSRIRESLEQVRTDPVVAIKASPEIIERLQTSAPEWLTAPVGQPKIELVPGTDMNPGAATVKWKGGRLEYDMHAACLAVLQALATAAEDYSQTPEEVG